MKLKSRTSTGSRLRPFYWEDVILPVLAVLAVVGIWQLLSARDSVPPGPGSPAQFRSNRLPWKPKSEQSVPAVASQPEAAGTSLRSPPLNLERGKDHARVEPESGGGSEGLPAEKVSQTGVGMTLTAGPTRLTEGLPSVFSSEQSAVTRIPKPASDGSLMELFEKHRSELPARQPVTMVPSATPSASALPSPFDPSVGALKRPKGQGPRVKTKHKAKVKKTTKSRKPKQGAVTQKTKRTAKVKKTAESRKPEQAVATQKKPQPNLSDPTPWSPRYHGTR